MILRRSLSFRVALLTAVLALLAAGAPPAEAQKGKRPSEPPSALVPPEEPPPPYPPLAEAQADSIRAVLRDYLAAVRRRDGAAAARLVSRETRDYYARMAAMAVSAPEAEVRAAPLMDRLSILMYRHRVPAGELRALSGDAAFAYTVDAGWVARTAQAVPSTGGRIYGEGDRAVLRSGGVDIHFAREDGAWRWDMMPVIRLASTALAPTPEMGITEDEFLMMVLRQSSGRKPSPRIWQPLP